MTDSRTGANEVHVMAPKKQPTNRPGASKPAAKTSSSKTANQNPMEYLFGWVGRQVGQVKKAVQTDVTKPAAKRAGSTAAPNKSATKPKAKPTANSPKEKSGPSVGPNVPAGGEKIIYRHDAVEEAEIPHRPGMILRRTIIDEVVVETSETAIDPKSPRSK